MRVPRAEILELLCAPRYVENGDGIVLTRYDLPPGTFILEVRENFAAASFDFLLFNSDWPVVPNGAECEVMPPVEKRVHMVAIKKEGSV